MSDLVKDVHSVDMDVSEREIAEGLKSKNPKRVEEASRLFIRKYYATLRRLARYWLGSAIKYMGDEDIVQDTLQALLEHSERIEPSKGIRSYAIRIAKNKALSAKRKAKMQAEHPGFGGIDGEDAVRDWIVMLIDSESDASAKLVREDCIEGFEDAKETLGPYKSEVWVVSRMGKTDEDGRQIYMTYSELAEVYGRTERTIKRWISDFVEALQSNPLVRPCFGFVD